MEHYEKQTQQQKQKQNCCYSCCCGERQKPKNIKTKLLTTFSTILLPKHATCNNIQQNNNKNNISDFVKETTNTTKLATNEETTTTKVIKTMSYFETFDDNKFECCKRKTQQNNQHSPPKAPSTSTVSQSTTSSTTTTATSTSTTTLPATTLTSTSTLKSTWTSITLKSNIISPMTSPSSSTSSLSSSIATNITSFHHKRYRTTATTTTATTTVGLRMLLLMALIFVCIFNVTAARAESLLGNLESCTNEGEEVAIQGITNSKCFKCACRNGFVNCDKETCPSIADCYLLDQKSDDCCLRCKGCIYRGVAYASGTEWTDADNPCKTYKCIASVVTETTMKCYQQCDDDQLTPPGLGECCPKCQGCKINGQIVTESQEVVASIDDRCLVCQCSGNKLTCAKKTCPILQCPISKQKLHPNECCPRCEEHRALMPVPGKCMFNNNLYYDKTQFTPDRCTNCTCTNGTSICQRNTCPILECSPEFSEMDGCCPRCITSEVRSECIYNGTTYLNNETWNLGPCRSCRCTAGNIRCSEMRCPAVKCRANQEMKVPSGECCPRCMDVAGTCTIFGDPHFKSFDGKFFSFQGSCKYLLTADCRDHTFSIRLTNDGRGTKRSSWAKTVTLKMKGTRINLGRRMRVKVNGSRVATNYTGGPILAIERSNESVVLKTELGINIEWDGNNFLQVTVPASYKHLLCGLCGNYNGVGRDDLTSRDGTNHSQDEVWRFANSWKVGGPKACSRKNEKLAAQPVCKKRRAETLCRPLRDTEVFGYCDNRLNPINYIESCKMDVCECPNGMCQCDSFAAYAHECKRFGVKLPDWRDLTGCPVGYWRRNSSSSTTIVAKITHNTATLTALSQPHSHSPISVPFTSNRLYGDNAQRGKIATIGTQSNHHHHRRTHHRKRKLKHTTNADDNELDDNEFLHKHVPKHLLTTRPNRTPPPLT